MRTSVGSIILNLLITILLISGLLGPGSGTISAQLVDQPKPEDGSVGTLMDSIETSKKSIVAQDSQGQPLHSISQPAEMWVDDDYDNQSSSGHTWGLDAFNQIQAAIDAASPNSTTKINILSGEYYERLTIDKPVELIGEDLGAGQFGTKINGTQGEQWALICVSANDMGTGDIYPDRDCFPAQGLQAYFTLKDLGYDDEHIILMLWRDDEPSTPTYDCEPGDDDDGVDEYVSIYDGTNNWLYGPDGIKGNSDDPVIDVDNKAVSKGALQEQIDNLSTLVTPDDQVLFYFVNHGRKYGTPEICQIYFEDANNGTAGQYLNAETLDLWLDRVDCRRMDIYLDMCRTHNFTRSSVNFTQESNRVIIGAAGDINNIAHAWFNAKATHFAGSWFFHPFWEVLGNGYSLQTAYEYALRASDLMAEAIKYAYQYPYLIDRVRDADKQSLIPYEGNLINVLCPGKDNIKIKNCLIEGDINYPGIGINQDIYNVDVLQTLVYDNNTDLQNVTTNCSAKDNNYFKFFPMNQSDLNHSFMIGSPEKFSRIFIELSPSGGGAGGAFVLQCAIDRNIWVNATITSDSTSNLSNSGDILFIPPIEWAYQAHNHSLNLNRTMYGYWIRLKLIDEYDTIPEGDYIELLYNSAGSVIIENNKIISNDYGIRLEGLETQVQNQIPDRGAISNVQIKGNKIFSNYKYGFYAWNSNNLTISDNICDLNNLSSIYCNISHSNVYSNNSCSNNEYGIVIIDAEQSSLINNTCTQNTKRGIFIGDSGNITIWNNICNFNNWSGLHSYNSKLLSFTKNICQNNDYGISHTSSSQNTLVDNTCNFNLKRGFSISQSDHIEIVNNTCRSNALGGIHLYYSNFNTIINNTCFENNYGISLSYSNFNNVYSNNCTLNVRRGIYIWYSDDIELIDNMCNFNNWSGVILLYSNDNIIKNSICESNTYMGIAFDHASNNVIENCSVYSNVLYDFYLENNSINNYAINTSFSTAYFEDPTPELIVMNYLHIQVNDSYGSPLAGSDIQIKDNDDTIYSTSAFGGNDPKTSSSGQLHWILTTDRIYKGNPVAVENLTLVTVKHNGFMFWNNNRSVDMSSSHFEYFYPNSIPGKVILQSPINNSYFNDSTPELRWTAGADEDSDPMTYYIQIDEAGDDWVTVVDDNATEIGELKWNISTPLADGDYQWRVCANDSYVDSSWSEIWQFKVDTYAPSSIITSPMNASFHDDLNSITGTAQDALIGTGVMKVEITIQQLSDNKYWSGSDWVDAETWLPTSGTTVWTFDATGVPLSSDILYCIQSRAIDHVNNVELNDAKIYFKIDFINPACDVEFPKNDVFLNKLDEITGFVCDHGGSGIDTAEISIQQLSDDNYWDGTTWVTENTWLEVFGNFSGYWTYNTTNVHWITDTEYSISTYVSDNVGNFRDIPNDVKFMFDNKPPDAKVSINDNANYTGEYIVSLTLQSEDSGSGVAQMSLKADDRDWSAVEAISDYKHLGFEFIPGEGVKTVFFKVMDKANNTVIVNDTIILDTIAPVITIVINNNSSETNSTNVVLNLTAFDELSGVHQMSFSQNGINWTAWETFNNMKYYTLSANDGKKIIYVRVNDLVGNIANPVTATIILNTSTGSTPGDGNGDGGEDGNDADNGKQPEEYFSSMDGFWIILSIVILIIVLLILFLFFKTEKLNFLKPSSKIEPEKPEMVSKPDIESVESETKDELPEDEMYDALDDLEKEDIQDL